MRFRSIQFRLNARQPGPLCWSLLSLCGIAFFTAAPLPTVAAQEVKTALAVTEEDEAAAEEAEARERIFGHLLYHNRRHQLLLKRAAREFAAGNTADAFLYLQTLFDSPQDSFAWIDDESRLVSVRAESMRLLGAQPPSVIRAYERLHEIDANQLLADAVDSRDPHLFREIGQRYYFTAAGFAALDWQASHWFDEGNMGQAARIWQGLVAEPAHRRRVTRPLLLKTAVALQYAGEIAAAREIIARLGDEGLKLPDGTTASAQWLAARVAASPLAVRLVNRTALPGQSDARPSAEITTPYLTPAWSLPYTSGPDELLNTLVEEWEHRQRENLQPLAVANSALVADGSIVIRDFGRIRALDAATGKVRWSYRCATSFQSVSRDSISRVASRSPAARSNAVDVRTAYATNAATGMLSTDGERVYAVDYIDLTRQQSSRDRFNHGIERTKNDPPQLVSREANRLIALAVKPESESGEQTPLWSIGGAVGTPAWFIRMDRNVDGRIVKEEFAGTAEQFQKIDTGGDGAIGLREAAENSGPSVEGNPLWGHFFLGAPLAVDGRLYAVTEADRQLNLVALKPETGDLLWTQAIGFVEIPIDMDPNRYGLQCTPSFADGVLVCSTQLGLLVGIDAASGSLLWAYYYSDEQSLSRVGRWPHRAQQSFGHTGFPSVVHIAGNRVVVLPRQSDSVHCVNLQTGRRLWTAPRQDAEYIGSLSGDTVLTVGSRFSRGLSLENGTERWATRLGMPSGRGVQAGDNYLVPLEEGRIATIELATGREIGFTIAVPEESESAGANEVEVPSPDADRWHPGNLVAVGDLVLSAGARELVAFPQAGAMLSSIERQYAHQPMSPGAKVRAAELNLALGEIDVARAQLTDVLTENMPADEVDRAETLLRELLYLQLRHQTGSSNLFAQLEQLSKTPTRRGRYLMQRAEALLAEGDFAGVLESTRDFAALNLDRPLPTVADPSLRVTAASWVRSIIGRVQNRFGDEQLARVAAHVDQQQQLALAAADSVRLERFLGVYGQWPQADRPRNELARRFINAGSFQKAELLLLWNRNSSDREAAAEATVMLAELWDRLGLWHEAAGLLQVYDHRFAGLHPGDGTSTSRLMPRLSASGLTAYALQQRTLPKWDITRVDIFERPWIEVDPQLEESYGSYRRRFPTGDYSTFQLLVKGSQGTETLTVIDRQTGLVVSDVPIPHRVTYPTSQQMGGVGHFVPLGGPAALNGISLLGGDSDQPLWTTEPRGLASQQEVLRVGPAGSSFCSFQARRHLIVADPGSGRILWQRTDLDPNGGLLNDPYAGLFGDDHVLTLFAADRSSYTVYQSATGEILRTGQLDVEINQQRRVFGRKLCYVAQTEHGQRIRVWDPLANRIEFDEPFDGRLFSAVTPEEELAVILPQGRLVVLDVAAGKIQLDCRLSDDDLNNLNYLRIFSSDDRYFVNLQRSIRVPPTRTYSYYASDTFLNAVHIQGDLLAINRNTSEVEWKRTLPQRSVVRTPQFRLPFLITLSGVRDRWNGNRQSLLVEVIDEATGETIGLKDDIKPDRVVQCTYEPEKSCILLHGLKTLVELQFGRGRQRLGVGDLGL